MAPSTALTGPIRNQPTTPPRIAPGRNQAAIKANQRGQLSAALVAGNPIPANRGASEIVTYPPITAKIHHGRASFFGSPCPPVSSVRKMETARDGVNVSALRAEMI